MSDRVVLRIRTGGGDVLYRGCSEEEAEALMEFYDSIGWDVHVVGMSTE